MNADAFAALLLELAPTREDLARGGVDEEGEVEGILACFRRLRREPSATPQAPRSDDELVRLVTVYDCSRVAVLGVGFDGRAQLEARGIRVAGWEADPIVVRPDGTVAVFEHDTPTAFLCGAQTGARFLDALAFALQSMMASNRRGEQGWRTEPLAERCAELAGWRESVRFWSCV